MTGAGRGVDARRVTDRLDAASPLTLPERLVSEVERQGGVPAALYVLALEGQGLRRMAGTDRLPEEIPTPRLVGPEVSEARAAELRGAVEAEAPGALALPLWRRGRAFAVLVAAGAPAQSLEPLVQDAASAIELAEHYTDRFHYTRRTRPTTPAAELQTDLLPPRIASVRGAEVAGAILPAYEVGGDWFDWAENSRETSFSIADAAGKGSWAAALSALGLSGLRAARRSGGSLDARALSIHQAVYDLGEPSAFITALIGRWGPEARAIEWIACGHPQPLLIAADGRIEELRAPVELPLGIFERERRFASGTRRLARGDRVVLYSDGVSERRMQDGRMFGREGIEAVLAEADVTSAAATASAIVAAVARSTVDPLQDDATVFVLAAG